MARIKYTVTFPAARPGDEVTWPNTVHVYPDANTPVPLQSGQSLNESLVFSGWSDAASIVFTRPAGDNDTVTVTSGSPSGTGAAVPAPSGGSSSLTEGIHLRAVANPYTLTGGLVFLVAADFTIIKQVGSDLTLGASTHGDGAAVISAAGGMFEQSMYVEAQLTADGSSSVPRILQAGAASFSDSGFFGLGIDGTLTLINGVDCWTTVAGLPSDVPAGGEAASSPQLALDNPIGTDSVAVYLDWFVWKR